LQTAAGNPTAAKQTLEKYAASHPLVSARALDIDQAYADISAAVHRGDGQAALSRAAGIPAFQGGYLLLLKGQAYLLVGDYPAAERELQAAVRRARAIDNPGEIIGRFPILEIMAHYYLGQLYEKSNKRDQAVNEYQDFLSHFTNSHTKLPQVAEARASLKRLMQ
jgi:tetratricopeptide (TPR) repeat protein